MPTTSAILESNLSLFNTCLRMWSSCAHNVLASNNLARTASKAIVPNRVRHSSKLVETQLLDSGTTTSPFHEILYVNKPEAEMYMHLKEN